MLKLAQIPPLTNATGIIDAAKEFAKLSEADLQQLKDEVAKMIKQDWADVWANGVEVCLQLLL